MGSSQTASYHKTYQNFNFKSNFPKVNGNFLILLGAYSKVVTKILIFPMAFPWRLPARFTGSWRLRYMDSKAVWVVSIGLFGPPSFNKAKVIIGIAG